MNRIANKNIITNKKECLKEGDQLLQRLNLGKSHFYVIFFQISYLISSRKLCNDIIFHYFIISFFFLNFKLIKPFL